MNKKRLHSFSLEMICFCLGVLTLLSLLYLTFLGNLFGLFNLELWIIFFCCALLGFAGLYGWSMPQEKRVFDPRSMPKNLLGYDEWGAYLEEIETD